MRRKPPYRFLLVVSFILALAHLIVGVSLVPVLPVAHWVKVSAVVALFLSWLLIPTTLLARHLRKRGLADALGWVGALLLGTFSSLFVLTLARDLALGVVAWILPAYIAETGAAWSAVGVIGVSLLITLFGFYHARRRARVVDIEIPLAHLPGALHGYTIVQISDIHVGTTIKRGYLQSIVDAVNALEADLVAITGDVVDGRVPDLAVHTAPLAALSARDGVYLVTGNHEYYSGEPAWSTEFTRLGLSVLKNRHVVIEHKDARLVLAGVTDWSAGQFIAEQASDPVAALAGAPEDAAVRILLAHQPRSAPAAAAAGFDLQLSGHTHGGQFWPWNLVVKLQQPYVAGLHRLDRLWVYTSRGTGYWGPPTRFGAPSEITRIRLVGGPAA